MSGAAAGARRQDIRAAARDLLGHDTLRPGQEEAVAAATAPPLVREETLSGLQLRDPEVIVRGFDRPNIHLSVDRFDDDTAKRRAAVEAAGEAARPLIVYAATRRHVEELASSLTEAGITALAYHAGLKRSDRAGREADFLSGRADVIVATNAFGIGVTPPASPFRGQRPSPSVQR